VPIDPDLTVPIYAVEINKYSLPLIEERRMNFFYTNQYQQATPWLNVVG
jgi:hypothetical protein